MFLPKEKFIKRSRTVRSGDTLERVEIVSVALRLFPQADFDFEFCEDRRSGKSDFLNCPDIRFSPAEHHRKPV